MKKYSKPIYCCNNCGEKLNSKVKICPKCGNDKRLIKIEISGRLEMRGRFIAKKFPKGAKKWVKEVISGWFFSADTNKFPKGVKKIRVIDTKNSYQEKITDKNTGEVIRDIKEPLNQHKQNKK